jgi:hypothetical protein
VQTLFYIRFANGFSMQLSFRGLKSRVCTLGPSQSITSLVVVVRFEDQRKWYTDVGTYQLFPLSSTGCQILELQLGGNIFWSAGLS